MRDGKSDMKVMRALSPVSVSDNTPQVTLVCDNRNGDAATLLLGLGSIADSDVTFTILVEEGDAGTVGATTLTDATAVDDKDLIGTENGAAFQFDSDNQVRTIGYKGTKAFWRATITPANNASAALLSAFFVHTHLRTIPNTTQTS